MPLANTRSKGTTVQREWSRVLWWWAILVTAMLLSTIAVVVLCGVGLMTLEGPVLIVFIGATFGGASVLAIGGGLILKPFETLR